MTHEDEDKPVDEQAASSHRNLTPSAAAKGNEQTDTEHRDKSETDVPTRHEILHQLYVLGQLVAVGVLTTAKANIIRSIYATMLAHLESPSSAGVSQFDGASLEKLREHPELLNLIAPLLSKETLEKIMMGYKD